MQKNQSEKVLIQIAAVLAVIAGIVVWQQEYLINLYIRDQLTHVGWVINGAILALFLLGMARMISLFLLYRAEEKALDIFTDVILSGETDAMAERLPPQSIIAMRFRTIAGFFSSRTEINHNALAATLLAQETSRTSFIKFINNILILAGVFGTIVSLTVALLGASTAISATESLRGIDTVIHGMSTALSTTMTAIVAYFLFGYFYLKLMDTQSYVLGRIEHETATQLMPRYQAATRSPEQALSELLTGTVETIEKFNTFINQIQTIGVSQNRMLENFEQLTEQNMQMLSDIRSILRAGFRLREDSETE